EAADLRRRHAEFMLRLAESANLTSEAGGVQQHGLVIPEQDNMRAALEWAMTSDQIEFGLDLMIALESFWVTSHPSEGARWFAQLLERADDIDPRLMARALRDWGGCAQIAGDIDRAEELYNESLERFRALGDEKYVGELLHRIATTSISRGETTGVHPLLAESLEIALRVGNRWGQCQVFGSLAHMTRYEGDLHRARELFSRSAELAIEIGNVWWETNMLANVTEIDLATGRVDDAEHNAKRTLALARSISDVTIVAWSLVYLARVAAARSDLERAGLIWGVVQAEEARGRIKTVTDPDWASLVAPLLEIENAAFERGRAEGQKLSLTEGVERIQASDA
ncbi:MAG TPA: tetratricopeptide repeat protein, partial [Actinomycetota bacterium]|nr:tetratricopeptide repeat protein [Actinomycetota bacterium]